MNEVRESLVIEVYTQSHCASCRHVEEFLTQCGVSFTVRDVEADSDALDELVSRGYMTTPVTRIDDEWISGFKPKRFHKLLYTAGIGT